MQHADEHRPLEGELEAAAIQEVVHDLAQTQPLPQSPEQQRTADPHTGQTPRPDVGKHHRPLAMARQRGNQPVELAAGVQDVLAAERADRALAHPLSLADALDEVEIAVPTGDFLADEHPDGVWGNESNIKPYRPKT